MTIRPAAAAPLAGALLATLITGAPARSAEIGVAQDPALGCTITLKGDIRPDDDNRFETMRNSVAAGTPCTVVLHSPGGALMAGLRIANLIQAAKLRTAVLREGRCASACALIWLSGSTRWIERGGLVGFHAAFTLDKGNAKVSGVGNARVGAYLNSLGLSDEAVTFATSAPPDGVNVLRATDEATHGIKFQVLDMRAMAAALATPIAPAALSLGEVVDTPDARCTAFWHGGRRPTATSAPSVVRDFCHDGYAAIYSPAHRHALFAASYVAQEDGRSFATRKASTEVVADPGIPAAEQPAPSEFGSERSVAWHLASTRDNRYTAAARSTLFASNTVPLKGPDQLRLLRLAEERIARIAAETPNGVYVVSGVVPARGPGGPRAVWRAVLTFDGTAGGAYIVDNQSWDVWQAVDLNRLSRIAGAVPFPAAAGVRALRLPPLE